MQVSETEILRLYVNDILLKRGVEEFMGKKETILEGVKDKMLARSTKCAIGDYTDRLTDRRTTD